MVGIQPQLNEPLCACGRLTVGTHVHHRVRIIHSGQTDSALHPLQQLEVNAIVLANLPCGYVGAVVADEVAGGQQQRRVGRPNLVGGDALLEQPLDKLRTLGARGTAQVAQQIVDVRVVRLAHVVCHQSTLTPPHMSCGRAKNVKNERATAMS